MDEKAVLELFAQRVRSLREGGQMTQAELGEAIGVHKVQVSRYETANLLPSADTLLKLADLFGVSVDFLLCRTDNPDVADQYSQRLKIDEKELIDAIRAGKLALATRFLSTLFEQQEEQRRPGNVFGRPTVTIQRMHTDSQVAFGPSDRNAAAHDALTQEDLNEAVTKAFKFYFLASKDAGPDETETGRKKKITVKEVDENLLARKLAERAEGEGDKS
jgi:transcriptional regulator with XRE-family HTH domain